jgi:hypothetical protein
MTLLRTYIHDHRNSNELISLLQAYILLSCLIICFFISGLRSAVAGQVLATCMTKSKVKQSLYTPWRRLGGAEV